MRFECEKNIFCEAVNNVSKAVALKSPIPTLEGIMLSLAENTLTLCAYNLEIGIRTKLDVTSGISGSCVINARLLGDIARKMPDGILEISVNEKLSAVIRSQNTEYVISALSADEFPELPLIDGDENLNISQGILKSMINQTIFAAGQNEAKPILTGELFEIKNGEFSLVAMDGYRLAVRRENINCEKDFYFIVPSKALSEIARMLKDDDKLECMVSVNKRHAKFEFNGYVFYTRLFDGEYHNYRGNIYEEFDTEAIIKTSDFISALDRCSLLINDKVKAPVKCRFEDGNIFVNCETKLGKIDDIIDISQNGGNFYIGFSDKFMMDSLKAAETDKIRMYLAKNGRPIKILPLIGESFIYIIMPVIL